LLFFRFQKLPRVAVRRKSVLLVPVRGRTYAAAVQPAWPQLQPLRAPFSAAIRQLSLQYFAPSCVWHVQPADAHCVAVSSAMALSFGSFDEKLAATGLNRRRVQAVSHR
jgi:hypothetical protein